MEPENEPRMTDGAVDDRPWRIGGDVSRPEKISGALPKYTNVARRAGLHGVVIIEVVIDIQGDVVDEHILQGLPMGLDRAAREAVKTWKFRPAMFKGQPVKVYDILEVHFEE